MSEPQLVDYNKGADLARDIIRVMKDNVEIDVAPKNISGDPFNWPVLTLITFLASFGISWDTSKGAWRKDSFARPNPNGEYMELKGD